MNEPPKRHHKQPQPPLVIPPNHVCFRLLCHSSRIGGIIGKSGHVIKTLQAQTLTKIRVEDPVPLSDDRIITVIGNTQLTKTLSFNSTTGLVNVGGSDDDGDDVFEVSDAQEALVRVFERVLEVAAEGEGEGGYMVGGGVVSCRILTDKSVIGSVIGKGGKVIEGIRKDCGCKIRVLVKDKLPSCASFNDEMVEIEGDVLATKKALVAVARCLQDCPYAQKTKMVTGRPDHAAPWENIPNGHMDYPSVSSEGDTYYPMDSRASQQEIMFKLLCSNDWVGRLIGKSGSIIQALQNESGATITIGAPVSDCDERLITITAMETPESGDSPAQNAVMLVFNRCVEIGYPSSMGTQITARLLISPNQMGCLLGKGGSIIADMRKVTGAYMKIVGDDEVPKCASDTDQVVLMTGEFVSVRDALFSVTGRLRNNLFSSKTSNDHGTRSTHPRGNGHHYNQQPQQQHHYNQQPQPQQHHYNPQQHHYNPQQQHYNPQQHHYNEHSNLNQSMDSLKLSSNTDHLSTPAQRQTRTVAGNPMVGQNVGKGSTSVKGGIELGRGGRAAIVKNMSVEIVVPQNVIGSVYGENGSNLTRLRQISGAKVVVHEPHSGTTDHILVISGTPDQTQSAQSLLQAFILADQS